LINNFIKDNDGIGMAQFAQFTTKLSSVFFDKSSKKKRARAMNLPVG
jgi:hypothetical protein